MLRVIVMKERKADPEEISLWTGGQRTVLLTRRDRRHSDRAATLEGRCIKNLG